MTSVDQWLDAYERIAMENKERIIYFSQLQRDAAASGFTVLPLKGVDALLRGNRSPGLKAMSDVDVLIEESALERFMDWLIAQGYRLKTAKPYWRESLLEPMTDLVAPNGQMLDVVWRIPGAPSVWQRTEQRATPVGNVTMLHAEDAATYARTYANRRGSWTARQRLKSIFWPDKKIVYARFGRKASRWEQLARMVGKPISFVATSRIFREWRGYRFGSFPAASLAAKAESHVR